MRITLTLLILSVLFVGTASAEPSAYITNSGSNNVSVIDVSTNAVVDTVDVGDGPQGVAVTPEGDFVYVAKQFSNNVSVIKVSTSKVVDTADVGDSPFSLGLFITPTTGLRAPSFLGAPMGDGNGSSSNSCAMASSTAANPSFPVYLLIPAFILIARLWRRRTNQR